VRIDLTEIDSPSGTTSRTSAWVPAMTVWQATHSPQPVARALQRSGERPRGH
jgi:hypothetical protein